MLEAFLNFYERTSEQNKAEQNYNIMDIMKSQLSNLHRKEKANEKIIYRNSSWKTG